MDSIDATRLNWPMAVGARHKSFGFRVCAILFAYALVFRVALPFAAAAPADFPGDPHALCLTAPAAGGEEAPPLPSSDHAACDLCCLSAATPLVAGPEFGLVALPVAAAPVEGERFPATAVHGPPAEAWSPHRAQRGPPERQ